MSTAEYRSAMLYLVVRLADESSFAEFYGEWFGTVFAWSMEFVKPDEHLALDIVQGNHDPRHPVHSRPRFARGTRCMARCKPLCRDRSSPSPPGIQTRDRAAARPESSLAAFAPQEDQLKASWLPSPPSPRRSTPPPSPPIPTLLSNNSASSLGGTPDSLYGPRPARSPVFAQFFEDAADVRAAGMPPDWELFAVGEGCRDSMLPEFRRSSAAVSPLTVARGFPFLCTGVARRRVCSRAAWSPGFSGDRPVAKLTTPFV